jgi:hypothetical protein
MSVIAHFLLTTGHIKTLYLCYKYRRYISMIYLIIKYRQHLLLKATPNDIEDDYEIVELSPSSNINQ